MRFLATGWPNTTNQYNSNSGNNRVQYPSQQAPSPSQQPPQQPPQVAGSQVVTAAPTAPAVVGGMASTQQWANQQSNRSPAQPSLNAIAHPPPPWDHRYTNQPSPLYPTPGNHQVRAFVCKYSSPKFIVI